MSSEGDERDLARRARVRVSGWSGDGWGFWAGCSNGCCNDNVDGCAALSSGEASRLLLEARRRSVIAAQGWDSGFFAIWLVWRLRRGLFQLSVTAVWLQCMLSVC